MGWGFWLDFFFWFTLPGNGCRPRYMHGLHSFLIFFYVVAMEQGESWELSVGRLYLEFKGELHHPLAAGLSPLRALHWRSGDVRQASFLSSQRPLRALRSCGLFRRREDVGEGPALLALVWP